MPKCFTVAIAGVGARGADTYASYQRKHPDRMKIVALAEPRSDRLALIAQEFGVPPERCFSSAEEMLAQPKLADVMIIATQDSQHVGHAIPALEKGYDLIVEKPISNNIEDILKLREKARETGRLVVVSHVLRYTPFFSKIKETLVSGIIGAPVTICALENVGFWHQAHSFVRGNWANSHNTQSPMILAKSCHDMDIILWLMGKSCTHVSSFGSLLHFRPGKMPAGAADRCLNGCKARAGCPYDAEKFYMSRVRSGNTGWPCDVLTPKPTEESIMEALRKGPYGRCVYACDNDVVDHQVVNMLFEGGETAAFTMTAFTAKNTREIKICCTLGEISGALDSGMITISPFGLEPTVIDTHSLTSDLDGHAGGDHRMVDLFFDCLEQGSHDARTAIEVSVQSHLMALAAEQSRLENGRSIAI